MQDLTGLDPGLVFLLLIWALPWKGLALWHAARNRQTAWYVVLFLVQTVGILEIIYLLFFRPKTGKQVKDSA